MGLWIESTTCFIVHLVYTNSVPMKRLLLTLMILVSALTASATHLIGGDLSYQYVSSSGSNSTYNVLLTLYCDLTGIQVPSTQTVNVTGGGAVYSVVVSQLKPAYNAGSMGAGLCTNGGSDIIVVEYAGQITFATTANYTFSWSTCCRPNGITSIANSASQTIYLEAKLNLAGGLRPYNNAVRWAPMGQLSGAVHHLHQQNIPIQEIDGDSTALVLRPALSAAGTSVTYASGYSAATPINCNVSHPVTLDPTTGVLSFKPATTQVSTLALRADDYVYDSTNANWFRIGYSMREVPIYVTTGGGGTIGVDSATSVNPGILTLYLDHNVFRGSITSGLNEFEWTQSGVSSGYASQLTANWDTAVMADILSLSLPNAVSGMGKLIVYTASDSSTAVGRCGSALAADTHTVHLPFVGAIMVGSTTPTWMSTSTYQLSSTAMIDSVTWLLNGGTWISYPATMSDPAEVQWTGATGELQAVRWGRLAADTVRIQVQVQSVGIDEGHGISKVYAMPNPANEVLYLSEEPAGQMEIWNLFGQKVETVAAARQIPVAHLPNGSYVLRWKDDQGAYRVRFVVQH
jgi:hypothetical protein